MVDAQNHPWMKVTTPITTPITPINLPSSIISSMQEFQNYNHLKKAALTAVAYHLNNVGPTGGLHGRTS